ncbi:MAG: hypothetical protein EAZ37_02185 [Burkholderiales bacterium]|nr:MAG: hypothetical protein EAZ37_02185 [Burkholderiales bacterium]
MPFRLSKSRDEDQKTKMSMSEIKLKVELSFQDLEGTAADSLRYKIRGAREVKELWMLRTDMHQLVSRALSQQEAAKRINALLPCFEQWIPARSLVKI